MILATPSSGLPSGPVWRRGWSGREPFCTCKTSHHTCAHTIYTCHTYIHTYYTHCACTTQCTNMILHNVMQRLLSMRIVNKAVATSCVYLAQRAHVHMYGVHPPRHTYIYTKIVPVVRLGWLAPTRQLKGHFVRNLF